MKKVAVLFAVFVFAVRVGGAQAAEPLVNVDWVKSNIGKPGIVFLDVRGKLGGASRADYMSAHIPGAVWSNYLKDGWRIKDKAGTIGQLPPVADLEKLIGGLGIGNNDHVVIIPVGKTSLDMGTATRIYWTFKTLGHDDVSILNGGMNAYTRDIDANTGKPLNPLEAGEIKISAKTFKGSLRKQMLVSKESVIKASLDKGVLIDNRPNKQFLGISKHSMAKRYGTIPNAINLPEKLLTDNGMIPDQASLKNLYNMAGVPTSGPQISFCNTGHWASLGWFVSHELFGDKQAKMYDGSMVEWTADSSLPVQVAVQK